MIVVDASVAVKWFLPEADQETALRMLHGSEALVAPALIRIEVAAAILRRVRMKQMEAADAKAACDAWVRLIEAGIIDLLADAELMPSAVELALAAGHNLQDCLYLAASELVDGPLVTCDRTLVERGRKVSKDVELLGARKDG